MADQLSPRRRFQFRLRTLMIVVTLFCVFGGYVAHEVKIVRERRALLDKLLVLHHGIYSLDANKDATPWLRRLLGDEPVDELLIPTEVSDEDAREIEAAFPEARAVNRPTPEAEATVRNEIGQASQW
jgi:hypothetical protein